MSVYKSIHITKQLSNDQITSAYNNDVSSTGLLTLDMSSNEKGRNTSCKCKRQRYNKTEHCDQARMTSGCNFTCYVFRAMKLKTLTLPDAIQLTSKSFELTHHSQN